MANLSTIKEEKKKNRSGQGGKKRKKHLTGNKKSTPKKDMTIAQLKEYMYNNKGGGKMSAPMKALIDKLKKDGGSSLDSSGIKVKW